jgi:phosphatidylserine decarboxylase
MGTTAGFAVFQDPTVNHHVGNLPSHATTHSWQLKKILNVWGEFLSSPESAAVLGQDNEGWFSPHGLSSLEEVANKARGSSYKFDEMFHCDPKAEHYGYKSWDDFFTRLFKDGIRPVAGEDDDNVVANACESKVYKVAHNVKARDQFWVKGQVRLVLDIVH